MKKYRVTVNGTVYEVELEELTGSVTVSAPAAPAAAPAPAASAAPAAGEQICAPMPGNILAVNVTAGQTVKKGDVVVRYQGGGNAGHTVVNDRGTFALHLLPSGIFREGVVNILGNGVALDCENLLAEINTLRAAGVSITPENLKISDRASLLLPWHRELDGLEEARLADKKYGSTKQGIAPFYSDKYQKKTVMAGELLHPQHLKEHLADLLEWKNLTIQKVYGAKGYTLDRKSTRLNSSHAT